MKYIYRNTTCGEIKGIGQDQYEEYRGVPYAEAGRWEDPQIIDGWEGTFDATAPGKYGYQFLAFHSKEEDNAVNNFYDDEAVRKSSYVYGENCQTLHIWRPAQGENLPVLVFIHGGSYNTGGNELPQADGSKLCQKGMIVISMGYRLNAFGNAVDETHTGNYGLKDQITALEWIQKNIASFGGDPARVTISVESAGAMSVQNLVYSPKAKGLFHRAIHFSGGGILKGIFQINTKETEIRFWKRICEKLGVQTLTELETAPAKDVFDTWLETTMEDPAFAFVQVPYVDGEYIPEEPDKLLAEGKFNHVPTIMSVLSEDMFPLTLYGAVMDWAKGCAKVQGEPTYAFQLSRANPGSEYGCYHGGDLMYIFGTQDSSWRPWEETDYRITREMQAYLIRFIKTGDPNGDEDAVWSPLGESQAWMQFGDAAHYMGEMSIEKLEETQGKNKPFPGM